ncbi:MAG: porin [Bacteroidales bacterium]|nr:porin [Bacteroidales bacterium]
MKTILILISFLIPVVSFSQSSQDVTKEKTSYPFARIFMGFRYGFKDTYKPQAAFEFNQGIIGYFHQIAPNVSGKIMFDVTRTTNFDNVKDTAYQSLVTTYFEGSKYTAYLKMAEIKWDINDHLSLRAGQLLNTQYLTFQDPFWGYRYVDVTFQERFRLGMPADFGVQLDVKAGEKFLNQFSVVNGEGPFRYQDINGKFIFSNNIQYSPVKGLTLKLYGDYGPAIDTGAAYGDKWVVSFFAGYKADRFRFGGEYDYVNNQKWENGYDQSGFSVFGGWNFYGKFDLLARWDHLEVKTPNEKKDMNYYIIGVQYEPVTMFTTAVNFRYLSEGELPFVFASFGLKF